MEPYQMTHRQWNHIPERELSPEEISNLGTIVHVHSVLLSYADLPSGERAYRYRDEEGKGTSNWVIFGAYIRKPMTRSDHRQKVIEAISEGFSVPAKVLSTYPDLQKG